MGENCFKKGSGKESNFTHSGNWNSPNSTPKREFKEVKSKISDPTSNFSDVSSQKENPLKKVEKNSSELSSSEKVPQNLLQPRPSSHPQTPTSNSTPPTFSINLPQFPGAQPLSDAQLSRILPLFPNLKNLLPKKIVVIGIGGVGGFCVECLYKSGFRNLIVIDGDRFDLSNQNRQIGSQFVGESKVGVFKRIYPGIAGIDLHLTPKNLSAIFPILEEADLIVDAIDDLPVKIALIEKFWKKMVSSTGAGRRIDPTKISTAPLSQTHTDPLARRLRRELKNRQWKGDLPVVFSSEPAKKGGSFIGVTGSFGLTLCHLAIEKLRELREER